VEPIRIAWPASLAFAATLVGGCGARTGFSVSASAGTADAGDAGTGGFDAGGGQSFRAVALSAGTDHACVLMSTGATKCWGFNRNGAIGDGSTTERHAPVDVVGLPSNIKIIAAGSMHTCALTTAGAVVCWGWNEFGQVGDGTEIDRHTPVPVVGLSSGVIAIAAGNGYSCAATDAGHVKCWGRTITPGGDVPTDVFTASFNATVTVGVAAGDEHACEVDPVAIAECWGSNAEGQLGGGTFANETGPNDVGGLFEQVASISAGNSYTCAVTLSGGAWCWGANFSVFGDPATLRESDNPVRVPGLESGVASISAGDVQACVVTTSGAAKCWGENDRGQLGNGSTTESLLPVDVVGLGSGVVSVSAGASYSCALTQDGVVKCWGANGNGTLGNGTTTDSPVPVEVVGF
jgi:alpha-tubulin suppressor-like RCC1 family protein